MLGADILLATLFSAAYSSSLLFHQYFDGLSVTHSVASLSLNILLCLSTHMTRKHPEDLKLLW